MSANLHEPMTEREFPATLAGLEEARQHVLAAARAIGCPDDLLFNLELATEEMLANIVNYAYQGRPPGTMTVACGRDGATGFRLVLRDAGQPFDPTEQPPPVLDGPLEERPIGGLGVFLTRQVSESCTYRRDGACNELTIVFRPAPPA